MDASIYQARFRLAKPPGNAIDFRLLVDAMNERWRDEETGVLLQQTFGSFATEHNIDLPEIEGLLAQTSVLRLDIDSQESDHAYLSLVVSNVVEVRRAVDGIVEDDLRKGDERLAMRALAWAGSFLLGQNEAREVLDGSRSDEAYRLRQMTVPMVASIVLQVGGMYLNAIVKHLGLRMEEWTLPETPVVNQDPRPSSALRM